MGRRYRPRRSKVWEIVIAAGILAGTFAVDWHLVATGAGR